MTRHFMRAAGLSALIACASTSAPKAGDTGTDDGSEPGASAAANRVTFTVYTDAACTQLPPLDSVVDLDVTRPCNPTPDASISALVCLSDRITYLNHPNISDCSSEGIPTELVVGACQEFPGPVPTWKLIEQESYTCVPLTTDS